MDKLTPRLAILQHFIDIPPENDFQRGYFSAVMDEALEDVEEAGHDIVDEAIKLANDATQFAWKLHRKHTLS